MSNKFTQLYKFFRIVGLLWNGIIHGIINRAAGVAERRRSVAERSRSVAERSRSVAERSRSHHLGPFDSAQGPHLRLLTSAGGSTNAHQPLSNHSGTALATPLRDQTSLWLSGELLWLRGGDRWSRGGDRWLSGVDRWLSGVEATSYQPRSVLKNPSFTACSTAI
jgi:hypothetical protein